MPKNFAIFAPWREKFKKFFIIDLLQKSLPFALSLSKGA